MAHALAAGDTPVAKMMITECSNEPKSVPDSVRGRLFDYDIQRGALTVNLDDFAIQTSDSGQPLRVWWPTQDPNSTPSNRAVKGRMDPATALDRMLAGIDWTYHAVSPNTLWVRHRCRAQANPPKTLRNSARPAHPFDVDGHDCDGKPVQFTLDRQPMENAIDAWIKVSGLHIGAFDTLRVIDAIHRHNSQSVHGRYPPLEALNKFLAPSRTHARVIGAVGSCHMQLLPDAPIHSALTMVHERTPPAPPRECVCQYFDSFGLRIALPRVCEEEEQLQFEGACDGTVSTVLH
jgi:hypothetical protein